MQKIFISSSSKDRKAALTICSAIEARGYPCWISNRDVGPGENFQETIVRAIRHAGLMVLVFSANANNSDEIKKEIALASQSRLAVIPVRIEDVTPSEALTYEFATRQWIDVFDDWERAIQQLLVHIAEILPHTAEATVSPPSSHWAQHDTNDVRQGRGAGSSGKRSLYFAVGAAAIFILLLAGWRLSTNPKSPSSAVNEASLASKNSPQTSAVPAAAPPAVQPAPAPPATDPAQIELAYWQSIRDSKNPADFKAYLEQYPHGAFAALARDRLDEATTASAQPSPPPPAPRKSAEGRAAPKKAPANSSDRNAPVQTAAAASQPTTAPAPPAAAPAEPAASQRFDGKWNVTLVCPKSPDGALAYSYDFPAEVKNAAFRGERGTEGQPGWLSLNGRVQADGAASLEARGMVGRTGYAVNHLDEGAYFSHTVVAHFDDTQGSGSWITVRTCNFTFRKI